jgi:predicted acylesterase/phospholipase RssA
MPRYRSFEEHLDPAVGPKRILALDGGGLRGVLTLGILREIESLLRERHGNDPDFRLADYFDLIAGTSTGAIIAAALSTGMSVDELHGKYFELGHAVFKRSLLRFGAVRAKFDGADVGKALKGVLGERRLGDPGYRTGLLVVAKRLDSGSPWLLGNNPKMPYMQRGVSSTTIANGEYPLWQVVRASTAAPHFFDPEKIQIGRAEPGVKAVHGEFVDGGVSPSNNPSLQALMAATVERCGFGWKTGPDDLLVVSVGTGKQNPELGLSNALTGTALVNAVRALAALMEDCSDQVETMMQWLSVSPTARRIDRLIGKVEPPLGGHALLSYLRYNVILRADWCREQLGIEIDDKSLKAMEAMDDPEQLIPLDGLGRTAGAVLVDTAHFPPAFDAGVKLG